jgi:hypothetical protein
MKTVRAFADAWREVMTERNAGRAISGG